MKNSSIVRILFGDNYLTDLNGKDFLMLTKASYNRKQATLTVVYNNQTSQFYNVPLFVYNQLAQAPSIDQHFKDHILNKYPNVIVN
jgi:hypothetical protein